MVVVLLFDDQYSSNVIDISSNRLIRNNAHIMCKYCNSISLLNEEDLSKCSSDDRCGLILNHFPNPLINNGRSLCTAALGCGAYLYAPLGTGIPRCTNDPRCTMSYWPYGCFGA